MKKKILLIAICVVTIFAFTGCKKNENNANNNVENTITVTETPLNESYDMEEAFTRIKDDDMTILEQSEVVEKYNLGENSKLEMKVLLDSDESNYKEIAMIKLTNETQTYEIQKMMLDRVETLKEKYKDNNEITKVLNDSENIRIKVQDGIGILIISSNANELMAIIDSTFYNM